MLPGPRETERARTGVVLGVLSLSALAYAVLSSEVIPALPALQSNLRTSETGVTWLLTGFLLSASVGTAIIGKLGDMYGKQRLLVWTLLTLTAGTLLAALSTSLIMLTVARIIQGVAGGIFPLSFSIARDEFPPHRVAGSIGLMSAILGAGGGLGLVVGGLIDERLSWHWLFWSPLPAMVLAAACAWRYIPESPVRSAGRVNWTAAVLLTAGMSTVLIAIAQTTAWGWTTPRTLALLATGLAVCVVWIAVEVRSSNPLINMAMMRVRGVWTVNLAAFGVGAGLYSCFLLLPRFAELPTSTGFGYGASVLVAGVYLLPCALGNLIVQAVPADQTGAASGMNTVLRTLGGALGGQISATFVVAGTTHDGLPGLTGFTKTFVMGALVLAGCVVAGLAIPARARAS